MGGTTLQHFCSKWHGVKATLQRLSGLFQSLGRSAWTLRKQRGKAWQASKRQKCFQDVIHTYIFIDYIQTIQIDDVIYKLYSILYIYRLYYIDGCYLLFTYIYIMFPNYQHFYLFWACCQSESKYIERCLVNSSISWKLDAIGRILHHPPGKDGLAYLWRFQPCLNCQPV